MHIEEVEAEAEPEPEPDADAESAKIYLKKRGVQEVALAHSLAPARLICDRFSFQIFPIFFPPLELRNHRKNSYETHSKWRALASLELPGACQSFYWIVSGSDR